MLQIGLRIGFKGEMIEARKEQSFILAEIGEKFREQAGRYVALTPSFYSKDFLVIRFAKAHKFGVSAGIQWLCAYPTEASQSA